MAATGTSVAGSKRDVRLDIVRGVAILIIAANHVTAMVQRAGYHGRKLPSLSDIGPSSAAELFVALSGYMVGLVYLNRQNIGEITLGRAKKLYVINLVAFAASLMVAILAAREISVATDFLRYREPHHPWSPLSALALLKMPFMLDILPLYTLLLLSAAPVRRIMARSIPLFYALSVALWGLAQVWHWAAPGSTPDTFLGWGFDPIAWQLLFFGMMPLGAAKVHLRLLALFDGQSRYAWTAVLAFIACAVIDWSINAGLIHSPRIAEKASLGPVRLGHGLLTLVSIFAVLSLARQFVGALPLRYVAVIGQNSLYCYAVSIPLTYAAGQLWFNAGGSLAYLAGVAIVVGGVCMTAWIRSEVSKWRAFEASSPA